MKHLLVTIAFVLSFAEINEAAVNRHINSYGYFYAQLSPHGVWMEFEDGIVAWRPTIMRRGWAPYSYGRWVWTDYGWYWDSYESFGYITYHYGRWHYDDYYGWIWIPDYDWGPAWVEWRYDDNYIGWAPLPPYAIFSINIGIHFSINYVTPYNHWQFVNYNHMCDPYVYNHYVGPKYKYRIFSNTKYRNDYGYDDGRIINRGVDIREVRSRTGQDIRQRNLVQVSDPRELNRSEKERNKDRNRNEIGSYIPPRDELVRDNIRNVDVRKIERKSSLESSKLEIGKRNSNTVGKDVRVRTEDGKNINREKEIIIAQPETRQRVQEREITERNRTQTPNEIEHQKRDVTISREKKNIQLETPRTNKREVKTETKTDTRSTEIRIQKREVEKRNFDLKNNEQRRTQDSRNSERTRTR
ncbi:MAG: hypothetical protein HXY50_01760 [Ignavibacteriaceae bacterium]|nr:hypothetical protein [Ignavibacteriaceae bacterium]